MDGKIAPGVRVALDGFNAVRTESPGLISAKDLHRSNGLKTLAG